MSTGKLMIAAVTLGASVGVISGLSHWSQSTIQTAIALLTAFGVVAFIWLPDIVRDRRHRRH